MPTKLIVLCVWMAIGVVAGLYTESFVSAGLQALALLGVMAGKEGVRKLLIVLYILTAGVSGTTFVLVAFMQGGASGSVARVAPSLVLALLSVLPSLYGIWCLTRSDVQRWMFRKSMDLPPSSRGA